MKNSILFRSIVISLSILVISCTKQRLHYDELTYSNNLYYFYDELFTGVAYYLHNDGSIQFEQEFNKGVPTNYKEWNENGLLIHEDKLKRGNILASKSFHDNKQLSMLAFYKDDKLTGEYKTFHSNGQLAIRAYYENDEVVGFIEEWDEEGTLIRGPEPEYVLERVSFYFDNNDFEKIRSFASKGSQLHIDFIEMLYDENNTRNKNDSHQIRDIECEIEKDKAYCTYLDGESTFSVILVKEEGKWLIDWTMIK
jgi:hypothetical protein